MILEKQPYGQPTRIPIDPVERFRIDTVRRMRLKMLQKRDALPVEPDAYPVSPLLNCTTVLWTEPSTRSPETFSSGCASTQMGSLSQTPGRLNLEVPERQFQLLRWNLFQPAQTVEGNAH